MHVAMGLCIVIIMVLFNEKLEYHLSRAEIFYRENNIEQAIEDAQMALSLCCAHASLDLSTSVEMTACDEIGGGDGEKAVALRIFIARCYSKLGDIEKSNALYRELVNEKVYLPPVILGLMHNNLAENKSDKVKKNMRLVRIYFGK